MRSRSDDELYAVQNRYLGPPGRTLLWQARYSAYGLWLGYVLLLLIVRAQVGVFGGLAGYGVVAVVAVVATQYTMRVVSPDRPALAVAGLFAAELRAPRRESRSRVWVLDPSSVLVSTERRPGAAR